MSELDRVIVIDDEQSVRMAISQTLQLEDFEVTEFATANGVAEQVAIDWPGVIVSDINLPSIAGFGGIKRLE